jgi:hypothetical protein
MKALAAFGLIAASLVIAAIGAGPAQHAAAAPGPQAISWWSNWFVSPTHNIHCRYFPGNSLMACTAQNKDHMLGVTVWGQPWHRSTTAGYSFPAGPTLRYGETWTATVDGEKVIRCSSRSTGMTCKSLMTGRGFFLSREQCSTL